MAAADITRIGAWIAAVFLLIALLSPNQAFAQAAATTTTVSSSQSPVTYPQAETFTATVTSTSTVNEGTVTFQSDGSTIAGCAAPPVSSGLATCATQLAAGSHSIVAVFNGSVSFQTSSSSTLTQVVNSAVTATQAIASVFLTKGHTITAFTPVTGGGTGSLSYGISPSLPTGLNFNTSTGAVSGMPGVASATASYTVTVTDSVGATASASFSLTVNGPVAATQAIPSTSLTVNLPATPFTPVTGSGGNAPLSYSVSPALPTGLNFNTASGVISGAPTVAAAARSYTVTITDTLGSSATASFTLSVGVIATTVAVTSSQNPSSFRQPVTFTATVTATGGTPTGNITFSDGGVAIGAVALSGGVAAFTTSTLTSGSHTIVASYTGNATLGPSTSPALAQTVNVPADSVKLRALQLDVTKVVAQSSGQAISGAIDDAISEGFGDGGVFVTPSQSGVRFNFAADPTSAEENDRSAQSKTTAASQGDSANGIPGLDDRSGRGRQTSSRIDDAFAAIDQQIPKKAPPKTFHEQKDWLFWIDLRGSGVDRWGSATSPAGPVVTQSTLHGLQLNALMGLTYKLRPNFLVGVLGGYETFNYTEQDINGKLTGDGWTLGSYLGWKITPTLLYDLAVTYSGIGYDGIAGTAQGNFSGQRWLVSTGLTGSYKAAGFLFEPSAKVYTLWEQENAYVDSLGTQQANHDFSTGRASSGFRVSYPLAWGGPWANDVLLVPYLGVYGDYYFNQDDAIDIAAAGGVPLASTPLLQGWSARVTGGLGAKLAEGSRISIGAQYGGIGSDTKIWTANAKAQVSF